MVVYEILHPAKLVQSVYPLITFSVKEGCVMFFQVNEHNFGIHASVLIAETEITHVLEYLSAPTVVFCSIRYDCKLSTEFKNFCNKRNITIARILNLDSAKPLTFIDGIVSLFQQKTVHMKKSCIEIDGIITCRSCNGKVCWKCFPNCSLETKDICVGCGNLL